MALSGAASTSACPARRPSRHEIDHAFGQPGFMQRFDDAPGAERRGGRGLQHHGVAADQRGRQLPGRNGAGKIPRRDQAHHADGLAHGEHVDAVALGGHQHAVQARAFAGEIAKDVDGAAHFALGFGEGLAFLARHFGAELIELAVEQVGGFEENGAARGRRHLRPCGKRSGRGIGGFSMSPADPLESSPTSSPVAGLRFSNVLPLSTHSPLM